MAALPTSDADRLDLVASRLYTAVLSDVIDSLGFRDQAMDARLRPVWPGATVAGRAHTLLTDGIVVVPRDVEDDAIRLALEKVDGENRMREAIRGGMTLAEAFARHGIL